MNINGWAHFNPVRIHFGQGCRALLAKMLVDQRALIVCSPRGRQQLESDYLLGEAIRCAKSLIWFDWVEANPNLNRLQNMIIDLRTADLDCVVAFGGGSAIDSAKVFALALSPAGRKLSLRELLYTAPSLTVGVSLPLYAIPTTCGTGSEVTPYATLWDRGERRKLSLSGPAIYPHTAFVDPELSYAAPYSVTLNTGLDAINQAAESIWNRNMTPMSEMLAQKALQKGIAALPRLLNELNNPNLRDIMAEVSLLAGLAISQTRTSLCHAISYPLTAHFEVPHGLACAFTMEAVLRHSLIVDDGRFQRLANALSLDGSESSEKLLNLFYGLNQQLQVAKQVREMVGSELQLYSLESQMNLIGRADNVLFSVDALVIRKILELSWLVN
jgi:alcohol dehydrogenase